MIERSGLSSWSLRRADRTACHWVMSGRTQPGRVNAALSGLPPIAAMMVHGSRTTRGCHVWTAPRRFATTSPEPAHVERACPSARATDATGAPSTCARATRGPTNPGSRSSRVPAPGRRSREPLEPTHDVAVQYLHQRDGPPLLEVESHGLPIDISDAAQHVAGGGEPGDRRRIDVRPLAA
jgi:hypothetical protein